MSRLREITDLVGDARGANGHAPEVLLLQLGEVGH
jgi:hypothetical protein